MSQMVTQTKYPKRSGYIYGSVAMPIYDLNRRLKQGTVRLLAWPLQKFDERFICLADCYKYKHQGDILKNFSNNLDIVIDMPKFHTDVFWHQAMFISMPGDENTKDYADSAKAETMTKQEFEKSIKGELKRHKLNAQ